MLPPAPPPNSLQWPPELNTFSHSHPPQKVHLYTTMGKAGHLFRPHHGIHLPNNHPHYDHNHCISKPLAHFWAPAHTKFNSHHHHAKTPITATQHHYPLPKIFFKKSTETGQCWSRLKGKATNHHTTKPQGGPSVRKTRVEDSPFSMTFHENYLWNVNVIPATSHKKSEQTN